MSDGVHLCVCTCLGGSERARSPFARRMGMICSFTFDFSYICIVIIVNSNSIHGKDLPKKCGKTAFKNVLRTFGALSRSVRVPNAHRHCIDRHSGLFWARSYRNNHQIRPNNRVQKHL
jgi:hypothetical protein